MAARPAVILRKHRQAAERKNAPEPASKPRKAPDDILVLVNGRDQDLGFLPAGMQEHLCWLDRAAGCSLTFAGRLP